MNNFGVIEVASAKTTTAPGWAYVPDRQPPPHAQAALPANRKRARSTAATGGAPPSLADVNARQEAKARREIEILDRDNARDVQIAIPAKRSGNGSNKPGAAGAKKYTPNVRKILQSQKTFTNHLDDYIALASQQEANPTASNTPVPTTGTETTTTATAVATTTTTAAKNPPRQQQRQASASAKPKQESDDTEMTDVDSVPTTQSEQQHLPTQTPDSDIHADNDNNPLLISHLPPLPSDENIRALLAAPPLSYLEARGTWPPNGCGGQQYPTRVFCALCGYWGRVRCMKCGTRVCALECLEVHREECITRYGL